MSKLSKAAEKVRENEIIHSDEIVKNFMGGDSYVVNPIDTLKLVAASSIFGEASYYRKDVKDGRYSWKKEFSDSLLEELFADYDGKSTTEIFTDTIDKALEYDFKSTLELAVQLRNEYNMRLNPQIIMVRAAIHPKRQEFTKNNPGKFDEYNQKVMARADEPMSQLAYYIFANNGKKNLPTILKNSIAKKLSGLNSFAVNKYKNHEIGMINAVRITHANSKILDELMKTGSVEVPEEKKTWEQKRSAGASWKDILSEDTFSHMALLRNLRNIFTEIDDIELCKETMKKLKDGVLNGKQFPFRYYSAYNMIEKCETVHHKPIILDALEECIDISIDNLPKLKGKTMCLSDNSGSAWGCVPTEYGSVTIANIDNLSSVIAAKCSDEGYVCKFGDEFIEYPVPKRAGTLELAKQISSKKYKDVGGSTEGGIWKFFKKAIDEKIVYDNIFIFSDQQAGTGGLYGTYKDKKEYTDYSLHGYINVYKLVLDYRKMVNPKVNVFSVQTAGYNNVLLPQNSYRCSLLTGWTGKEISYAHQINTLFDELDKKNS